MRVAYLECFSGISGNMLLGALLDAGISEDVLRQTLASLNIGAELQVTRVNRNGIFSTNVEVLSAGISQEHDRSHSHHEHQHEHTLTRAGHHHEHQNHDAKAGANERGHQDAHHLSLSTITRIIRQAEIPEPARHVAIRAFEMLGQAEAKIHNVPIESIHFREVGAVDSIADIVCGAVACHALGVASFICSPLNVGGGTIQCAHGEFPVPAPSTLALLMGAPIYSSGIQAELVTPTGAAMVRALECRFSPFPHIAVETIGYGAGSRNLNGRPNVLRISVGELEPVTQRLAHGPTSSSNVEEL